MGCSSISAPDRGPVPLAGTGMRLAIVVARFNELVTRLLLAGALETAARHGIAETDIEVTAPNPDYDREPCPIYSQGIHAIHAFVAAGRGVAYMSCRAPLTSS